MATFKSDHDGFLVGELLDGSRDLLVAQQRSAAVQREIRNDVKTIARAMGVAVSNARRANNQASGARAPMAAPTQPRDGRGRFVAGRAAVSPSGRGGLFSGGAASGTTRGAASPARGGAVAVAGTRDAGGRFVAGQQRPDGGGDLRIPGAIGDGLSRVSDRIGQLAHAMSSSTDNIDPTLNAAKEFGDVVRPLGRGLSVLFGRSAERKKERWYNRFWTALRNLGGDKKASAATSRVGWFGPGAGAGGEAGGGGSLIGSMVGGLFGRGKGLLGLLGKGAGLLRRLPLIGGLITGGLALGSVFGMNDDPSKSDEENRAARYRDTGGALGMGIGGIAGGVLGSLLGPAGTIAGGYLGSMLGEKVGQALGDWSKQLMDANLPGKMMAAWDEVTSRVGELWAGAKGAAGKAVDTVRDGANWANDAVKGATGIDVKATAGRTVDATKTAAVAAANATVDAAKVAAPIIADAAAAMVPETIRNVVGAASNWVLGKTSARYESGGKGAGAVSSGRGDRGGVSYGTYQLSSKTGTLGEFLGSSGYGDQFAGLTPGTPAFAAKWKQIAKTDPAFGDAQHKFIEDTHYNPQVAKLKAAGIDVGGSGAAFKDAVWSTAVQFGGDSSLIQKALAGKDASKMSDAEKVAAIQDYKKANNDALFRNSSPSVRAGTLARASAERDSLLRLAGASAAGSGSIPLGAGANIAGVSQNSIPPLPMANVPPSVPTNLPKPPEIQAMPTKLNSDPRAPQSVSVTLPETTGQNVGDRALAHVVSGGIGAVG